MPGRPSESLPWPPSSPRAADFPAARRPRRRVRPGTLSASFHGRDLFAPVAAQLALSGPDRTMLRRAEVSRIPEWPDDLSEIVYVDHYGNAMTGLRANTLPATATLVFGDHILPKARTFSDVPLDSPFWYENANGLAEISVNGGRADTTLGIAIGSPVAVISL